MSGWKSIVTSAMFILAVVLVVTLVAGMAKVSISGRAERMVYGGAIGLLAGMYWQQRQLNIFLIKGIADVKAFLASIREGEK